MLQKLIVGLLAFTVIGAAGVGIYDSTRNQADNSAQAQVLANPAQADQVIMQNDAQPAAPQAAPQIAPTPTLEAAPDAIAADSAVTDSAAAGAGDGTGPVQVAEQQAVDMVGEPWAAVGTIAAFDTAGMTFALADGTQIYVELGPSHYWQSQDVTLVEGETVTVAGFFNGDQYHAATVTKVDGSQLVVRTADGLPLWSGGASTAGNGQNGAANGTTTTQVAAEDWVTLDGTVTAVAASSLTVQTQAGEMLMLQLGEPGFAQQQGITFAAGDGISVLGFWQDGMFRAGEITKLATAERLMLLDPNGRPLWGGPGRAGNRSGQTTSTTTQAGTAAQSGTTQGQGQGQGGQGQGAQGQGGQGQSGQGGQGGQGQGGQGRNQSAQVPAAQWETMNGTVTLIEPLALTLRLQDGQTVRVNLGQVDFWTEQGMWFSVNDMLSVDGYWLNGQFEAGVVTLGSGQQLTIRDQYGRLLWSDPTQASQGQGGQGGQGQGGQGSQGQGGQGGGGNGNGYRGGRS